MAMGHNVTVDPRIAKTRARLQNALFELARERGIEAVSVTDIVQRAAVNRTTFYLHYSDKETLLADALDGVAERAGANIRDIDIESHEPPAALTDFLVHVEEHADLYRRVFTEPGYSVALSRLRDRLGQAIQLHIDEVGEQPVRDVPTRFVIASIVGSILGMISEWLHQEPHADATEAALWIWTIARPPSGSES